ncbi:MAG TPA: prephenate dehydrogenase/arogenate dehydrogenase family protein [Methanomicrobia archaeon]|nr:prephenate dehydrogenase/arogenate dehydrogenase family protein [Methanomicrobia archaeon]
MPVTSVGIVGFGRFGQLCARHLTPHFKVVAYSRKNRTTHADGMGVQLVGLEECARQDIVIISVSISAFERVVEQIAAHVKEGALVIDVCSVKEHPVAVMERLLPATVRCVGSHPLFGPDTARDSVAGHTVALTPVRNAVLDDVRTFLERLGLNVIITTPEEHDVQMARSLALLHFVGSALAAIDIGRVTLSTATHARLLEVVDIVNNDSRQLIEDMHTYNRHAGTIRRELIKALEDLDHELTGAAAKRS